MPYKEISKKQSRSWTPPHAAGDLQAKALAAPPGTRPLGVQTTMYPSARSKILPSKRKKKLGQTTFKEENAFLTSPFIEEEVRKSVFQMKHNNAPGPNGFPTELYHHFWYVIKSDLLELLGCLHGGHLDLFRLNFGKSIFLSKIREA